MALAAIGVLKRAAAWRNHGGSVALARGCEEMAC